MILLIVSLAVFGNQVFFTGCSAQISDTESPSMSSPEEIPFGIRLSEESEETTQSEALDFTLPPMTLPPYISGIDISDHAVTIPPMTDTNYLIQLKSLELSILKMTQQEDKTGQSDEEKRQRKTALDIATKLVDNQLANTFQKDVIEAQKKATALSKRLNPMVVPINGMLTSVFNVLASMKSLPIVHIQPLVKQTLMITDPELQANSQADLGKLLDIQIAFIQLCDAKIDGYENERPLVVSISQMIQRMSSVMASLAHIVKNKHIHRQTTTTRPDTRQATRHSPTNPAIQSNNVNNQIDNSNRAPVPVQHAPVLPVPVQVQDVGANNIKKNEINMERIRLLEDKIRRNTALRQQSSQSGPKLPLDGLQLQLGNLMTELIAETLSKVRRYCYIASWWPKSFTDYHAILSVKLTGLLGGAIGLSSAAGQVADVPEREVLTEVDSDLVQMSGIRGPGGEQLANPLKGVLNSLGPTLNTVPVVNTVLTPLHALLGTGVPLLGTLGVLGRR